MLEPNSRRLLMESLQPPEGYRLDWAVGTTYTLDLMALLTAPVAFAFSDWQDRDGRPTCDPLALLKAVRQYASRVCIFCQAGKIHVPKSYQPLLASLEDSIIEANAPKGGSFHPKLWFLRFVGKEEQTVHFRVLCLSRNMTFDRSWDTLLCLEGPLRDRVNAFRVNHPLGQFVESLPTFGVRPISTIWHERISQLAHEIRRVEFEIPEPFSELAFWPIGIGKDARLPFPTQFGRMFVISPFVDDGLIGDLKKSKAPIELLSRPERMGLLSKKTISQIDKAWVLDDTANPEPGEAEEEVQVADNSAQEVIADDLPLVGLHAKVYVIDEGQASRVFTGSANATRAAFNRNVEFLVELLGKRSKCGIDVMIGESSDGESKRASSLADLLQPYIASETESEYDEELESFGQQVDQFAKRLSQAALSANCEPGSMEDCFQIQIAPHNKMKVRPESDWTVRVRPVSVTESHFRPLDCAASIWAEFDAISMLGLTSFFIFEIKSKALKASRRFVLNIPLVGAPGSRHEAILRDLLSDRDRVMRFLLLLLLDTGARDLSKFMEKSNNGEGHFAFIHSIFGATLFESLMQALDRDPERLEQVAHVIQDLQKTNKGQELLPDDLNAIWMPIWAVRTEQLQRISGSEGGK